MKKSLILAALLLFSACGKSGSSVDPKLVGSWSFSGASCSKPLAEPTEVLVIQSSGEAFQTTTQGACLIADHYTLANLPNGLSVTFHGATATGCPGFTPATENQTVLVTYEVTSKNLNLIQSNGCSSSYLKN